MASPVCTNTGHTVRSTSGLYLVSFMGKYAELFGYKSEECAPLNFIAKLTNVILYRETKLKLKCPNYFYKTAVTMTIIYLFTLRPKM